MDGYERLGAMRAQPRARAAAGHRMPLVADAAGIEPERKLGTERCLRGRHRRRDETRPAVGREKAAGGKETLRRIAAPLDGIERGVLLVADLGEAREIEIARAVVLEGRQRGVL